MVYTEEHKVQKETNPNDTISFEYFYKHNE